MKRTLKKKYDLFKTYYYFGADLTGKYQMPVLKGTQFVPQKDEVISFNERKILNKEEKWVDFFIDDSNFECFWNNIDRYFDIMKKAKVIITPDFSMTPELMPGQNIWNCERNRIAAYYLQSNGFNIVPVASWCYKEDFEWCFDGLPDNSSIAVSNNGISKAEYSKRIFLAGIEELIKQKHPSHIIVCGYYMKELEKYDNIVYYDGFSQRWNKRKRNGR